MTPGKVALRSSCTPVGQLRYTGSFSMSFIHWNVHDKKRACVKMLVPRSNTALPARVVFSTALLNVFNGSRQDADEKYKFDIFKIIIFIIKIINIKYMFTLSEDLFTFMTKLVLYTVWK